MLSVFISNVSIVPLYDIYVQALNYTTFNYS